jgi:hypothetical protein
MIKTILFLASALTFISCSTTYRLYEYESAGREGVGFASKQDSVAFQYNLNTGQSQMEVMVKNRSGVPCYIHLDKSAFIINGQSYPWLPQNNTLQATVRQPTLNELDQQILTTNIVGGSISNPASQLLIPPGAQSATRTISFGIDLEESTIPFKRFNIVKETPEGTQFKVNIQSHYYEKEQSPHVIQTFIAYSDGNGPLQFRRDSFYLSAVFKGKGASQTWMEERYSGGHSLIRIQHHTGAASAIVGLGVLAAAVILAPDNGNANSD